MFLLAAGPKAGLIAPGHKDDRCHALLRDGSDVGIQPNSGQQSSVLTYEKRLSVDNRVGVTGVRNRALLRHECLYPVQTATHLMDRVIPQVLLNQGVLSVANPVRLLPARMPRTVAAPQRAGVQTLVATLPRLRVCVCAVLPS